MTEATGTPAPQEARRGRECDCPRWWVRCAHTDIDAERPRATLFLGDSRQVRWVNGVPTEFQVEPFVVWDISELKAPLKVFRGADYDAALDAFHEAETRLLARD